MISCSHNNNPLHAHNTKDHSHTGRSLSGLAEEWRKKLPPVCFLMSFFDCISHTCQLWFVDTEKALAAVVGNNRRERHTYLHTHTHTPACQATLHGNPTLLKVPPHLTSHRPTVWRTPNKFALFPTQKTVHVNHFNLLICMTRAVLCVHPSPPCSIPNLAP